MMQTTLLVLPNTQQSFRRWGLLTEWIVQRCYKLSPVPELSAFGIFFFISKKIEKCVLHRKRYFEPPTNIIDANRNLRESQIVD